MVIYHIVRNTIKSKTSSSKQDEGGEVMIEATYCLILTIFVIFFLISFGFLLYQYTMFAVVANEVAEEAVMNYKLKDISTTEDISEDEMYDAITSVELYRYSNVFGYGSKYETKAEENTTSLAASRLQKTSLAKDESDLTVEIASVSDDVGRRHYKVTITKQYSFLLGGFLSLIGLDDVQTLTATSIVSDVDILNYVNSVKTTKYLSDELQSYSSAAGAVDDLIEIIGDAMDLIEKAMK